jgi:hypothetical protein
LWYFCILFLGKGWWLGGEFVWLAVAVWVKP